MPTAEEIVLDTHVLLWWQAGGDLLSRHAKRAIEDASTIVLSSISFWEVGMLEGKGRIALDRPLRRWTEDVLSAPRIRCRSLTAQIAVAASRLTDLHGDPADRMIAATALDGEACLVTKDGRLRRWGRRAGLATIW